MTRKHEGRFYWLYLPWTTRILEGRFHWLGLPWKLTLFSLGFRCALKSKRCTETSCQDSKLSEEPCKLTNPPHNSQPAVKFTRAFEPRFRSLVIVLPYKEALLKPQVNIVELWIVTSRKLLSLWKSMLTSIATGHGGEMSAFSSSSALPIKGKINQ